MKTYSIHITGQGPACTGGVQDVDIIISRLLTELRANGSIEQASVIVEGRRLQLVGEPQPHPKTDDPKPAKKPRGKPAKADDAKTDDAKADDAKAEGEAESNAAEESNPEESAPPQV